MDALLCFQSSLVQDVAVPLTLSMGCDDLSVCLPHQSGNSQQAGVRSSSLIPHGVFDDCNDARLLWPRGVGTLPSP